VQKIATDFENNSEDFWNEIHRLSETNALAKLLVDTDDFLATDDEAREIEQWLCQIPGWDDSDAPEYAQHPVLIDDVDNDIFEARTGRELCGYGIDVDVHCKALDDSITVLIDAETTSEDLPDTDSLIADLERATGRTVTQSVIGWHPTGDSDQVYTTFAFEPIQF
jgi:hypothetical protein